MKCCAPNRQISLTRHKGSFLKSVNRQSILSFGVFNEIFPHKRVTASPQSSTAVQTEWSGPGIQYAGTDRA